MPLLVSSSMPQERACEFVSTPVGNLPSPAPANKTGRRQGKAADLEKQVCSFLVKKCKWLTP